MSEFVPPLSMNLATLAFEGRHYRLMLKNLVGEAGVNGPDHLAVKELSTPAMKVRVTVPSSGVGSVYIDSDLTKHGIYECHLLNEVEIDIDPADETEDRIDLIYAQVRDPQNTNTPNDEDWVVTKTTGVADNPPSVPSLPQDAHALAEVLVPAGVGAIEEDLHITDLREYCGLWRKGRGAPVAPTVRESDVDTSANGATVDALTFDEKKDRRYRITAHGMIRNQQGSGINIVAALKDPSGGHQQVALYDNTPNGSLRPYDFNFPYAATADADDQTWEVVAGSSNSFRFEADSGDDSTGFGTATLAVEDVGGLDVPAGSDGQP